MIEDRRLAENDERLLSGAQAAEFLGVKAATLYAYASRGLIESIPAQSGRERSYRLSELIKLRNSSRGIKNQRDSEPAVWTGPLIKSSITEIQSGGHCYRGINAIDLARKSTPFEAVAELLWETDDDSDVEWCKVKPFSIPKQLKKSVSIESDYLDLYKLVLVSVDMFETVARKLLSDNIFSDARRIIVTMSLTPGFAEQRDVYLSNSQFPIAQTLLHALSGTKSIERAELINAALVLCADHELNASALAARVAASCDASLYSCLLSALGTFSGIMHGAASRRAEDMVSTSLRFKSVATWLKDYMRQSDQMPGFGTELYAGGDPRAKLLIESAIAVSPRNNKSLNRLIEIVEGVREKLGAEPNLDFGLAAMSYALALPPGAGSAVFAVSRCSGWIAHSIEQRMYGGVIRPRARYIGRS